MGTHVDTGSLYLSMDRFQEISGKNFRIGLAKERGLKTQCKKKLCIVSSDKNLMYDLMFEASHANDCYQVEIRKDDRLNVYFGQCTYTNESSVGDAWSRYVAHPKLWAVVQDDDFCDSYRDKIRNY